MSLKTLFFSFILLLFGVGALGQSIKIDGEIRPRAEFRNGFKTLPPSDAQAAFAISQRTRLNAFYGNQLFKAYISAQDIRVWGDVAQLDMGASNKFGIHQAWGEFLFTEKLSVKLGRQELVYDDSRILGNVGWAQQARAHDLGLLKYESEKFKAHFGFAFNQKQEVLFGTVYQDIANYKAMQFVWLHGNFGKSGLSFLFLNNGVEKMTKAATDTEVAEYKTIYSQTIGARFTPTFGPVKLAAAAYYQMGKINTDSTKLSAMYFALEAGFAPTEATGIAVGFEYLSGTSLKDKTEDAQTGKSFTPLYGTNHKFNGHMDYFYVGNHANDVGLIDIYASFKARFGEKWSLFVTPHYFMAAADVYKRKPVTLDFKSDFNEEAYDKLSKGLGVEFDFGLSYTPEKNMSFSLGISEMFGTETLGYVKGYSSTDDYKKNGTWAYLMFTFKPDFYSN
jgi:hypothetical protein